MDAIFIDIKTTGSDPIYSQINHMTLADLSQSPFDIKQIPIPSLHEELESIKMLSTMLPSRSLVLVRDDFVIDYLKACCRQYALNFKPTRTDYLYKYADQLDTEINIPRFEGELKHFYKDYKNYYYLPAEDEAYHKSVSEWVDKSARIQATARTAYTKKTGTFVPVYPDIYNDIDPNLLFQNEYRKAPLYVLEDHIDLTNAKVLSSYMFRP